MYICIEGNIGAGKSTVAKALAKKRRVIFLAERFKDNILLPLFYKNKKKLAFSLEFSFLIDRHAQLSNHFNVHGKKDIIADYSIYKCLWFSKANLNKKDFIFYKKQFRIIQKQLPSPDLIVFLDTDSSNLVRNIKKRGRRYESGIAETYLDSISKRYNKGLEDLEKVNVLRVKINEYTEKTTDQIIGRIEKYLNSHLNSK
jgi:deoxyguanosine kinase